MAYDLHALDQHNIRGTDVNSLLRLQDLATEVAAHSPLQYERAKATKALERIAKELEKRKSPR